MTLIPYTEGMETSRKPGRLLLTGLLVLAGAAASAKARAQRPAKSSRAEADFYYQNGVDQYASGRYPQALAAFREALRRDPGNRVARIAAERVRGEIALTASEKASARRAPGNRGAPPVEDTILQRVARVLAFERTLGDERERAGRLAAMQGRIAELLAERRISRARRRAFSKDAELHALSRRLS